MAYNLFVAYDLMKPGQNYDAVRERIMELGQWHQFQLSLFYVHSELDPYAAYTHVAQVMDGNDRLAVINAAQDLGAVVSNWDHPPIEAINSVWLTP